MSQVRFLPGAHASAGSIPAGAPRARAEGLDPDTAADLQAKADVLFKGETLRSILLNAYGWWTVSSIALYSGYVMVIAGILFAILAFLGFRHARRAAAEVAERVLRKEGTTQAA